MNACFAIYKTAIPSGNGDRVVQSAFPILHIHNSTYTSYRELESLKGKKTNDKQKAWEVGVE